MQRLCPWARDVRRVSSLYLINTAHKLVVSLSQIHLCFHCMFYLGLKRIYRIFEYSFEIIERIFVRLETNIRLNEYSFERIFVWKRIFVYYLWTTTRFCIYWRDGNIYSYLNCLLLANLCLIHFAAKIILL